MQLSQSHHPVSSAQVAGSGKEEPASAGLAERWRDRLGRWVGVGHDVLLGDGGIGHDGGVGGRVGRTKHATTEASGGASAWFAVSGVDTVW